jgi:hypothetical protein
MENVQNCTEFILVTSVPFVYNNVNTNHVYKAPLIKHNRTDNNALVQRLVNYDLP